MSMYPVLLTKAIFLNAGLASVAIHHLTMSQQLRQELQKKAYSFITQQQGTSKEMAQIIIESLKLDLSA